VQNFSSAPDERIFSGGNNDALEIIKAWVATSLAFAIFQVGGQVLNWSFLIALLIAAFTCGAGFVIHELAHRRVARGYGAEAHFVANNSWLLISILLSFTGFFLAAPGAVWHRGYLTKRQGGLIALAGPASNYVLAVLFLGLLIVVQQGIGPSWLATVGRVGFLINSWLGLFNMIPFGPFDGAKVIAWDRMVFGVAVAIGIVLVFVLPRYLNTLIGF
jgi:Zn-dependent protease